jgi:hypothetical protein
MMGSGVRIPLAAPVQAPESAGDSDDLIPANRVEALDGESLSLLPTI